MSRSSFDQARSQVQPHDHAVFVYDTRDQLGEGLRHFIAEGLRAHELSIFVHSFASDEEAWAFVEAHRPDEQKLQNGDLVVVRLYREAFEGSAPRIDYDHVTSVVDALVDHARAAGRRGVRVFVDASRRYFEDGRDKEWFEFESWLGRRLQADAGLVCAYRREHATRPDLFPEMLRTHAYRFGAPGR